MSLTMGQLAKRAQVNDQTVRYYERRGLRGCVWMRRERAKQSKQRRECPVLEILNEDNIDNA